MRGERCGWRCSLLVPNRRNGISADGRMVDSVITFLVDLADEDAGKRNELYN
jgi:hypothetical protein